MKALTCGVCALVLVFLLNSVHAQCGCCGCCAGTHAVPMAMSPISGIPLPAPTNFTTPTSQGGVSYVNKLTQPIDRGTYTLKYAIHMFDGRVLLADFLPRGQTIRGLESRSGGRKMVTSVGDNRLVTVTDPTSSQVVATFDN